jgi:hypothetical protein
MRAVAIVVVDEDRKDSIQVLVDATITAPFRVWPPRPGAASPWGCTFCRVIAIAEVPSRLVVKAAVISYRF